MREGIIVISYQENDDSIANAVLTSVTFEVQLPSIPARAPQRCKNPLDMFALIPPLDIS
jgi:hypothetical protein